MSYKAPKELQDKPDNPAGYMFTPPTTPSTSPKKADAKSAMVDGPYGGKKPQG